LHAVLSDPDGAWRLSPISMRRVLPSGLSTPSAPAIRSFRGSIERPACSLSTLRSAGYPNAAQDSLPAGGLTFAGQVSSCRAATAVSVLYMTSSSAKFPGAL